MVDSSKIFDGLLVLQYRSGKKKALSLLVEKYQNRLCRHSFWYTHDLEASKDIVQDCWGVVIKKLDSLKDPNLFGSWVFRIVTRKSLDFVLKHKKDLRKLKDYALTAEPSEHLGDSSTEVKKLNGAMHTLPIEQQEVLRLFYIESYSLKEIGDILDISVGTIKSRLFHAREKLKKVLKR